MKWTADRLKELQALLTDGPEVAQLTHLRSRHTKCETARRHAALLPVKVAARQPTALGRPLVPTRSELKGTPNASTLPIN